MLCQFLIASLSRAEELKSKQKISMSKKIWIALSLPLIGVAVYLATQDNRQTQVDASSPSSTTNERISTAKSSPTKAGNKRVIQTFLCDAE